MKSTCPNVRFFFDGGFGLIAAEPTQTPCRVSSENETTSSLWGELPRAPLQLCECCAERGQQVFIVRWNRYSTGTAQGYLSTCMRCAAAARCARVLREPLLEGNVHSSLPARPISAKRCENLRVDPNGDLFFGGVLVLSTGLSQRTDGCRDAPTR
jgi:hypothetical protein